MLINFNRLKTFYNALAQKMKSFRGNWNQNDPSADDYIKNRPFYSEGVQEVELVSKTSFDFDGTNEMYNPFRLSLVGGQTYTVVFDGVTYETVAKKTYEDESFIGNNSILGWYDSVDTGEPFFIDVWMGDGEQEVTFAVNEYGTHTISISAKEEVVHKLDKKFIDMPDGIVTEETLPNILENNLAPVAFTNNYDSLSGKPTIYTDVVRYTDQTLTNAQKTQVRNNIGAASTEVVRYDYNQGLYDSQKTQARKNIGAVASNEVVMLTEQSLSDSKQQVARNNINVPSNDEVVKVSEQTLTPTQQAQARNNIDASNYAHLINRPNLPSMTGAGTAYNMIPADETLSQTTTTVNGTVFKCIGIVNTPFTAYTAPFITAQGASTYRFYSDGVVDLISGMCIRNTQEGLQFAISRGGYIYIPQTSTATIKSLTVYTDCVIDESDIPDTIAHTSDINELKENGGVGYVEGETVHTIDPKFLPSSVEKHIFFDGTPTKLDLSSVGLGYAYLCSASDLVSIAKGQNVHYEFTIDDIKYSGIMDNVGYNPDLTAPYLHDTKVMWTGGANIGYPLLVYESTLGGTGFSLFSGTGRDVGDITNIKLWTEYTENELYFITGYSNGSNVVFFSVDQDKAIRGARNLKLAVKYLDSGDNVVYLIPSSFTCDFNGQSCDVLLHNIESAQVQRIQIKNGQVTVL